jgi:hypothetical protein
MTAGSTNQPPLARKLPEGRDAAYWAKPVGKLSLAQVQAGAVNINVAGRRVVGPIQGFGQMWQKTFRVRLEGASVTPAEAIRAWKDDFPRFWPKGASFYAPLAGIAPGEVGLFTLSPMRGPVRLSSGVLVIYADDESFTFMTPEGHMLAAWITFSATEEDGVTVVQAQALERANDPLYELAGALGGDRANNLFWEQTLRNLAAHFGVAGQVHTQVACVDPRRQWSHASNIWHNAGLRSGLHTVIAPLRWIAKPFRKGVSPSS